jgi:hypothetical protein
MLRIKSRETCRLTTAAIFAAVSAIGAVAGAETISDGNSNVTINTSGPSPFITSWTVDGVDQYGGTPAGSEDFQIATNGGSLASINSLPLATTPFTLGGLATTVYTGSGYTVTVENTLTGGTPGSGTSAMVEQITINNTEDVASAVSPAIAQVGAISFQLVQVSNLTVDAMANNNTLTLSPSTNPNTATQTNPLGTTVTVGVDMTPTSFTAGNVGSESASVGPFVGDDGFTFEWDGVIDPGGSYQVSIDESVTGATSGETPPAVPLPSAAWNSLATLAGLAAIGIARRMRKPIA